MRKTKCRHFGGKLRLCEPIKVVLKQLMGIECGELFQLNLILLNRKKLKIDVFVFFYDKKCMCEVQIADLLGVMAEFHF